MTAITAKSRSQLRLEATTSLSPADALGLVRQAAGNVKGGGTSLLTSGLQNIGAQINIEREGTNALAMSITSGKRLIELCTFSARVNGARADGKTVLQVGGLETYKTNQSKFLMIIPTGPKTIAGMAPYKRFLDAVAEALRAREPNAEITVDVPTTA
jgi:hypothetical protein